MHKIEITKGKKNSMIEINDSQRNSLYLLVMFRMGDLERRKDLLLLEMSGDTRHPVCLQYSILEIENEISMLYDLKKKFN